MNIYAKYRAARLASLLAMLAIAYCFYRVVPQGMSGEVQSVKLWIGVAFIAAAIGVACALAMYYYRAELQRSEAENAATATLARTSTNPKRPSETTVRKSPKKGV